MFPAGLPGIGLLILRLSVATSAALWVHQNWQWPPGVLLIVYAMVAALLFVGYLTPVVALAVLATHLSAPHGGDSSFIIVFNAAALCLLGPGAYSIDALRFGRRIVEIDGE
jgi:hypothetical protein